MTAIKSLRQIVRVDQNLITAILLGLITGLGAILRVYQLGTESYWIDEVLTAQTAQKSLTQLFDWTNGVVHVYMILAHFWVQWFGFSEAATRFLSVLFGIAAIPVMYAVGQALFEKRVGLISALLLAVSGVHIYHSQDFRFYSLVVFFTLTFFWFYIRFLSSGKIFYFILYVANGAILYYTHHMTMFALAAQGIYFLLQWNRFRARRLLWALAQILMLAALFPSISGYIYEYFDYSQGAVLESAGFQPMAQLQLPGWGQPFRMLKRYLFFTKAWMLAIGLVFFAGIFLLYLLNQGRKGKWSALWHRLKKTGAALAQERPRLLLVGCWLLVPNLIPFALSFVLGPMYLERYTISAAPALYLLIAVLILKIDNLISPLLSIGVLLVLVSPGLYDYYVDDVKEQWRETAAYVMQEAEPGDILLFSPHPTLGIVTATRPGFSWYYRGDLPTCEVVTWAKSEAAIIAEVTDCTAGYNRIWLVTKIYSKLDSDIGGLESFFFNPNIDAIRLIKQQQFTQTALYLFETN